MSHSQKIKNIACELSQKIESTYWREYFKGLADNFISEYEEEGLNEKYAYVKRLERLNGGMGSLNDMPHSNEVGILIREFYFHINQELIQLWSALGYETNDINAIQPYEPGVIVKFVVGKPRCINSDGTIKYVPDKKWVREQEWKIERVGDPDVTNMLQYWLVQGSKHALVRHDAIEPISE